MKKFILNIILMCFMTNVVLGQCSGLVSIADSLELVYFYNNFNGDDWEEDLGWTTQPLSEWGGVTLTQIGDSCYVKEIYFNDNTFNNIVDLSGELYDMSFEYIEKLFLFDAELNGTIPNFSNMPNLKILNLNLNNNLTGELPDFTYLQNLEELHLNSAFLDGVIPNFSNLSNLKKLYLSNNTWNSALPDFSSLPNLELLNVSLGGLIGEIPPLSNCINLEVLTLGDNQLTGTIPDFNLPSLISLNLEENLLNGDIPNFNFLTSLEHLFLSNNNLSGSLPNFENNENLNRVFINGNNLTGTIPNYVLDNLETLDLAYNGLNGIIPNFQNIQYLKVLAVQGNQLSGSVPEFDNLTQLNDFILCPGNNFYGAIPNLFNIPNINSADINWDCVYNADIKGHAFWNPNDSCDFNSEAIPVINAFVAIDNGYYVQTDENGYYELGSDIGLHVIDYYPPNIIFQQACEDSYTVEVDSLSQIIADINFANEATIECPYLIVDIVSPPLFQGEPTTYSVSYCNGGTAIAENVQIDIKFSSSLNIMGSELSYYPVNSLLRFELGDLGPADCGTFTIDAEVEDNTPINSAVCATATIHPIDLCTDTIEIDNWDGSDLTVQAYCLEGGFDEPDSIRFVIINQGANMTSDSSMWRIYQDDLLVSWDGIPLLENGDSLEVFQVVELNADGESATYRMIAEQAEGHPSLSDPQVVVEGCGGFPFSTGYVTSQMQPDEDPYIEIECHEVEEVAGIMGPDLQAMPIGEDSVGMIASPKGMWEEHFIPIHSEIEYFIWLKLPEYEEEGDSANIFITDTLDHLFLDINTIQITYKSHDYQVSIRDSNVLNFESYIPLEEEEQISYVKFKINFREEITAPDSLLNNQAHIYYNQVEAIPTGTIFHTIGVEDLPGVSNENLIREKVNLAEVYPNPANNFIALLIKEKNIQTSNFSLTIQDVYGETHHTSTINRAQNEISTKHLPTGIYFLQLYNEEEELLQVKKLIVQH